MNGSEPVSLSLPTRESSTWAASSNNRFECTLPISAFAVDRRFFQPADGWHSALCRNGWARDRESSKKFGNPSAFDLAAQSSDQHCDRGYHMDSSVGASGRVCMFAVSTSLGGSSNDRGRARVRLYTGVSTCKKPISTCLLSVDFGLHLQALFLRTGLAVSENRL